MNWRQPLRLFAFAAFSAAVAGQTSAAEVRRVVILKIDGLNADLLSSLMAERDPASGKSRLPWMSHIFREGGTIFENFYVRGISLSAPSWSVLDTGHHGIIRGNVEYDRYTGAVYDYLNVFPLYLNYARGAQVDSAGVEVLDRAGIPLLRDAFPYEAVYQSFQLFQRGVRWTTLGSVLTKRIRSELLLAPVESFGPTPLDQLLGQQTEDELSQAMANPSVVYVDYFRGDMDHQGHATNQRQALADALAHIDALAGRIWTLIERSPLASQTIFVAVSDHGMNNRPDVTSQGFSLPDFFTSAAGGGHHVITNRHLLSDYKLRGLDPLVHRVVTPSNASLYLQGQAARYPTAWFDLDGNERSAVHLRNNDLNRIQILLQQLSRKDLPPSVRSAATAYFEQVIDRHREAWESTCRQMQEELQALDGAIRQRRQAVSTLPAKWTEEQRWRGEDKAARRLKRELTSWERESKAYTNFLDHLQALLHVQPDPAKPFTVPIGKILAERELGDNNDLGDLQQYVVGPGPAGLVLNAAGHLDVERSFCTLDYFPLLLSQTVRNSPQAQLSVHPIDFVAMRLRDGSFPQEPSAEHAYWIYGGERSQLLILTDRKGQITLRPIAGLKAKPGGSAHWNAISFRPDLPLQLFEDPQLRLPVGADRANWLTSWHSEREWLNATHQCHYSNAVIGLVADLSAVGPNVPGRPGLNPVLVRYERRRRELVQADFHIFASDGWNFNARNFNPGGNHGSFFRISTHSVWMMAGAGLPVKSVEEPYDSLNFASTILSLLGKPAPMPDRVVQLQ